MSPTPKWISLSNFSSMLAAGNSPFRFGHDHDELVKNAMLSRVVPVRGIEEGQREYRWIEPDLTPDADIEVLFGRVSVPREKIHIPPVYGPLFPVAGRSFTPRMRFEHVQLDETEAWDWLHKNILPPCHQAEALTSASPGEIRNAIKTAYDVAEAARTKPPNIRQLANLVQLQLKSMGYAVSKTQIMKLGKEKEFECRRRRPGTTVRSERQHPEISTPSPRGPGKARHT
jgi:hypothetical protein